MHLLRNKPIGRFSPVSLFRPESLVVTGARSEIGGQVMANLQAGGFQGAVTLAESAADLAALATAPDLAIIAAPPTRELFAALAAKGTFAAVVVCEADGLVEPELRGPVRVLGPDSFGIGVPAIGLNASRAHLA